MVVNFAYRLRPWTVPLIALVAVILTLVNITGRPWASLPFAGDGGNVYGWPFSYLNQELSNKQASQFAMHDPSQSFVVSPGIINWDAKSFDDLNLKLLLTNIVIVLILLIVVGTFAELLQHRLLASNGSRSRAWMITLALGVAICAASRSAVVVSGVIYYHHSYLLVSILVQCLSVISLIIGTLYLMFSRNSLT